MKKVFINCPYWEREYSDDERQIQYPDIIKRMLDIAKVLFKDDNLIADYYMSDIDLRTNVSDMMDCDYYFSIDGLWALEGGYRDVDVIAETIFKNKGIDKFAKVERWFIFSEEEWKKLCKASEFNSSVGPTGPKGVI